MAAERRSPWLYALFGCLGLVLVIVVVIAALTFVGVRTARNIAADNEDPVRRAQRALEILGADEAPGGFHAVAVVSVPFVIDMAILSDLPPGDEPWAGEFGERGFYYVQALWGGDDLRAFFDGETSEAAALRDMGLEIDLEENLGRGDLDREDVAARWATFRGSTMFGQGEQIGELVTLIEFDCPQDERMRMGIWFGPATETGRADETQDGNATDWVPASEAIAAFLQPIHPCGAAAADGG
ncbi:MAG: hypothetical protein OXG74_02355 [Acidobacteria bacterium]|nr:hypothetical protein [Acidobacteriota bacterium]